MASEEAQLEWLYDYIVQFLKSPGWKVPIMEFIDEHCVVFDSDDENKFEYTRLHNSFREMIDRLLANLCQELNISQELFAKACLKGLHIPSHKRIFEQVIACDNFLSFKKLMIRRNKELEAEALKMLQSEEGPQFSKGMENVYVKQEEAELEHAIAISIAIEQERMRIALSEEEELARVLRLSELEHQEWLARQRMAELQEKAQIEALQQQEETQKRISSFEAKQKAEALREAEETARRTAGKSQAQLAAEQAERQRKEAESRQKVLIEFTGEESKTGRKPNLGVGSSGNLDIASGAQESLRSKQAGFSVQTGLSQAGFNSNVAEGRPGYFGPQSGNPESIYAGTQSAQPGVPGSVYAGSQSTQPGAPGSFAGTQSGAPGSIYSGSQTGAPGSIYPGSQSGVPGSFAGTQSGASGSIYGTQPGAPGSVYSGSQSGASPSYASSGIKGSGAYDNRAEESAGFTQDISGAKGLSEEARRRKAAEDEKVEALRRQRSGEQEAKGKPSKSAVEGRQEANLPPLQLKKQFTGDFTVAHVDTTDTMQQAEDLRSKAEEIFKSNAIDNDADSNAARDAESLRARKERLKKQRDLLLSKKRAEREQELKEYLDAGGPDLTKDKVNDAELQKRKKLAERIKASSGN